MDKWHPRSKEQPSFDDRVDVPPGSHVCSVCRGSSACPSTPPSCSAPLGFVQLHSPAVHIFPRGTNLLSKTAPSETESSTLASWQKQRTVAVSGNTAR